MKNDELKKLIENAEGKSTDDIVAEIQRMSGIDRQVEIDKSNAKINEAQAKFDADIKALNEKHTNDLAEVNSKLAGFDGWINPTEHQKVVEELNGFKEVETKKKRSDYMKGQGLDTNYADLVTPTIDWDKATWDAEKQTFTGDEFTKSVDAAKTKYPNLFHQVKSGGSPANTGYYGKQVDVTDLTKL